MSYSSDPKDLAELELERELRQMFEVDSQKDLENYLTCVDNLQEDSWSANIQEMYRAIHTIKGGSVTVNADAILNVATILEDLLSELRYLETTPFLEDGQLQEILLEGGEIIASVFNNQQDNVTSKIERIKFLQQNIQENYLQDWSEQAQIQIEFAEEGFDLVVLDLELALNDLSETAKVADEIISLAGELINNLEEIGRELELGAGWDILLQEASQLLNNPEPNLWKTQWSYYFRSLKASAKTGGKSIDKKSTENNEEIDNLSDHMELSEDLASVDQDSFDLGEISNLLDEIETEENKKSDQAEETKQNSQVLESTVATKTKTKLTEDIKIPISLSRLDKSANSIVDTIIASRSLESSYENLYQDLVKLVNLAKDNIQYITQLRQIQDDYAILDNLNRKARHNSQGPNPESYRQGYTTINRLLENSLRLSELGTEVEIIANKTAGRLQKLNNHITSLKNVVEDSRLVPFKNISFRVKAILRDLTNRYNKQINLTVEGEQIELDVGTTKRLEPILLHLIRNAFDHGLESPEERIAQGKPEKGAIHLNLKRRGSSYTLSIKDDGQGIDPKKIATKAQKGKFPLTSTENSQELLSVICQPGFSSQSEVTDVSGRGVGMDVVAEQIALLQGSLSLETVLGEGTTFEIDFPVPHLLIPCLLLEAGDRSFAIPTDQVVMINLWENLAAIPVNKPCVKYHWEITEDGEILPGLDLLGYWYPQLKNHSLNNNNIGVYVRLQPDRPGIWLLADRLLGKLELKVQPLPLPLIAPPGVMGVSLQANGLLLPILELSSLMEYLTPKAEELTTSISSPDISLTEEKSQAILIVDDAALIRRRIEASLSAHGYITQTFADGLEAWNWLQINPHPTLIITDIEMPNLDGFTLINRCRQNNWDFPILVISSRIAKEWVQEVRRLGGTDFLTKGFSTQELIAKIEGCVAKNSSRV